MLGSRCGRGFVSFVLSDLCTGGSLYPLALVFLVFCFALVNQGSILLGCTLWCTLFSAAVETLYKTAWVHYVHKLCSTQFKTLICLLKHDV